MTLDTMTPNDPSPNTAVEPKFRLESKSDSSAVTANTSLEPPI